MIPDSNPLRENERNLNLRLRAFLTFIVFVVGASIIVYNILISTISQQVSAIIKDDLQQVLETAAESVDVEMLYDLAENGEPNEAGFSDDPRYIALLDTLDEIHRVEPDAWPYLYIPGEYPNEVIFVVDLISRYEPETAATFMETYPSNSGYILTGLERQVFREVDPPFVQAITRWGDRTDWDWLKNGLHGLAAWLVDSGIFKKQEFGIYEDKYGRWASGYMPLENDNGGRPAAVGVDFKAELIEPEYARVRQLIYWIYGAFGVLSIFILVNFFQRLLNPLSRLTRIATNIQYDLPTEEKSFRNFGKEHASEEIVVLAEVLEEMVEQLRQRESRYHAVIDAQDSLIVRTTPDGKFTFSNQAYDDLRGSSKPKKLTNLNEEDYHPGDRKETIEFAAEVNRTLTVEDPTRKHEVRIKDQEGKFRWYQWTVTGIFNDQGELIEAQSVGQDITELKDVQKELERVNTRLRDISHELINASEQERNKIAREVHDDMLNYLSELVLNLEGDIPAKIVNQTYQMIADRLRETVYNLRPPMLSYGLNYGLKDYVHTLTDRLEGVAEIHFDLTEGEANYPEEVDIHLFRIVQQACENAVEHADLKNLSISANLQPDEIYLLVEDDGVGFGWSADGFIDDSVGQQRFGLAGMFERGLIVGANVDIYSEEGCGTRIEVMWRAEEYQRVKV